MPRKNQKRKNENSQSGRRKPKPIKFNQSEIESERKLLGTSNQENAFDEKQEMESNSGSVPIQASDEFTMSTSSTAAAAADGNENDCTNQLDKIDDVQNDDTITIPAAYINSLSNRTFNYISHEKDASSSFFISSFSIELISLFEGAKGKKGETNRNEFT